MPALDRALSLIGIRRKQSEEPIINHPLPRGNRPDISVRYVAGPGAPLWTERSYEHMARAGYTKNSDVYACVSLIATTGKQVKIDRQGKGKASGDLLIKAGGPSFIESWLSYILLAGNAYVEIAHNLVGVDSLHLIQPDRISARLKREADAKYPEVDVWRAVDVKGMPYPIQPEDLMHSRLFNPFDPVIGMAPLEAAMLRVDAQNEGATLLKSLLQRGFAPGWIEAAKDSLWEDTQIAQLKERMRQSKLSGEELFLENAQYHQIGFSPMEAGVTEQQKMTKRDIASVFHVPPQLIGDTETQTYSNYQEARRALYTEAVFPLLVQFRDDWNRTIGIPYLQSELTWDRDSFESIAAARSEATDRVQKLWASGLITQNEARRDLEYDPVDGGDTFYAPSNFLPLAGSADEGA